MPAALTLPLVPLALPPATAAQPAPHPAAGRCSAPARDEADDIAFSIGWDHAAWRLAPPADHLHSGNPVRAGWLAARAALGSRSRRPTTAVRQWLALRLRAWMEGAAVEPVQVNPALLSRLARPACPVTRQPQAARVVVRLNPQAAYAAGNLAWVSPAAAQALAQHPWAALLAQARQGEQPGGATFDAAASLRLAVLASFAMPLPHDTAAGLPLVVMPPPGARLLNPVQAMQVMLTRVFLQPGAVRRIDQLATLMGDAGTRLAYRVFMLTMHARRLAAGHAIGRDECTRILEDAWQQPLLQDRWRRLALRLSAAECERIVRLAAARGWGDGGWRWLPEQAAADGWRLLDSEAGPNGPAAHDVVPAAAVPQRAGARLRT